MTAIRPIKTSAIPLRDLRFTSNPAGRSANRWPFATVWRTGESYSSVSFPVDSGAEGMRLERVPLEWLSGQGHRSDTDFRYKFSGV
jgi:hypothetical protein